MSCTRRSFLALAVSLSWSMLASLGMVDSTSSSFCLSSADLDSSSTDAEAPYRFLAASARNLSATVNRLAGRGGRGRSMFFSPRCKLANASFRWRVACWASLSADWLRCGDTFSPKSRLDLAPAIPSSGPVDVTEEELCRPSAVAEVRRRCDVANDVAPRGEDVVVWQVLAGCCCRGSVGDRLGNAEMLTPVVPLVVFPTSHRSCNRNGNQMTARRLRL